MSYKRKIPEAVPIRLAAEVLSVHPSTIRRWIRLGLVLAIRIGPQTIRIPRSEIAKLRKNKLVFNQPTVPPAIPTA